MKENLSKKTKNKRVILAKIFNKSGVKKTRKIST